MCVRPLLREQHNAAAAPCGSKVDDPLVARPGPRTRLLGSGRDERAVDQDIGLVEHLADDRLVTGHVTQGAVGVARVHQNVGALSGAERPDERQQPVWLGHWLAAEHGDAIAWVRGIQQRVGETLDGDQVAAASIPAIGGRAECATADRATLQLGNASPSRTPL